MATPSQRDNAIDLLRGIVMVLMALDHARDFFGGEGPRPTDLRRATAALFFTRWVTHFCAPVFVLLAGVAAYLYGARGRTPAQLSRFLVTRGTWLVVLEVTVVRVGWDFDLRDRFVLLQVIWAIGWSMVVLAALVHLPRRAVGAFGLALITGHNLLDPVPAARFGALSGLWHVVHAPASVRLPGDVRAYVAYPLVPWIGVIAVGYALGPLLARPPEARRRPLLALGGAVTLLFVGLRAARWYGDPTPWAPQRTTILTVASFLNCEKYPPSLLYLAMTLGPALVALALLGRARGRAADVLVVFGRVPLFYYVLHLYLLHAGAALIGWGRGRADDRGLRLPLPAVYLAWVVAVALLFPLCRWFAGVKARRRDGWLSYL